MIRYTTAKGRREATLGQFPLMSLADARIAAAYFRKEVRDGIDPLLEKQKIELPDIETVDQLFHDWYRTDLSRRLKHPKIPYRVYTKDISPVIGIKCIAEVTARDVREVLVTIEPLLFLPIARLQNTTPSFKLNQPTQLLTLIS